MVVLLPQEKYKRLETVLKAESLKKENEDRSRLPDTPKTAQDIWQQSVIGDYLARFKVKDWLLTLKIAWVVTVCFHPFHYESSHNTTKECCDRLLLQNDRPKAQKAMEATWNTMEKKEKIMWIKKAAEDQKRYEVRIVKSMSISSRAVSSLLYLSILSLRFPLQLQQHNTPCC